jgi:hypothetical protein
VTPWNWPIWSITSHHRPETHLIPALQRTSQHPGVRVTMDRGIRLDLRPWRHRIALTTRHDDPATTPPVVLELVDISFAGHHVVSQPTDKRWPPA